MVEPEKKDQTPATLQRDLFEISTGGVNTEFRVYTNVLDLWDLLPKYDVSGQAKRYHQEVDINERVRKIPVRHKFHRDQLISDHESFVDLELHIEPALIEHKKRVWRSFTDDAGKKRRKRIYLRDENGNYIYEPSYVYPGLREDKVEEALRYLLAHGQGHFSAERTGVAFSVKQIQRELARTGSSMNLDEIKESLEVLSRARCEIYGLDVEGKRRNVMGSNFLPSLMMVDRDTYTSRMAAGEDTQCYAQFHMMVTVGIQNNQFRITNYQKHQRLDNLFSRYLHKVLRTSFLNASYNGSPYILSTNRAMAEFGRKIDRKDNTRSIMITGIKDLMKQRVIEHYEEDEPQRDPRDRRVVLDRTFKLYPTEEFIREMIDSNARHRQNYELFQDWAETTGLAQRANQLSRDQELLRKELIDYRIGSRRALELIEQYPINILRRCLRETRSKQQAGTLKNPSGYILKGLEEGWFETEGGSPSGSTASDSNDRGSDDIVEDVLPNPEHRARLPEDVQHLLDAEWEKWDSATRQNFNQYGAASPYIRSLLGIEY